MAVAVDTKVPHTGSFLSDWGAWPRGPLAGGGDGDVDALENADQAQVRAQFYYPFSQVPDRLLRRWSELTSVAVRTTGARR